MKYDDFRKGGKVSIWTGNFTSDVELDDYINMRRAFEKDFDFVLNERDMPETKVEDEAVPIRALVDGFSWSELYAPAVNQLAIRQGVERATTMVVFLNFEYSREHAKPNPEAQLRFLGVVDFAVETSD